MNDISDNHFSEMHGGRLFAFPIDPKLLLGNQPLKDLIDAVTKEEEKKESQEVEYFEFGAKARVFVPRLHPFEAIQRTPDNTGDVLSWMHAKGIPFACNDSGEIRVFYTNGKNEDLKLGSFAVYRETNGIGSFMVLTSEQFNYDFHLPAEKVPTGATVAHLYDEENEEA